MTNVDEKNNSGFIFGLTLGAAIGALSAVLINKNSEDQVVQNFESKVKEFFQDLVNGVQPKKTESSKKIEFISLDEEIRNQETIIKKKTHPKMFVKARK